MVYDKIDDTDTRASTAGAMAKPLLGLPNTVPRFPTGGAGAKPARVSKHCSVPG